MVETRVPSITLHAILHRLNFTNSVVSEARGFAGGIWVFWNSSEVLVNVITVDDQIINMFVRHSGQHPWLLSALYTSPNPLIRHDLWQYIQQFGTNLHFPWLLAGDFNQGFWPSEKKGGNPLSRNSLRPLHRMVDQCGLLDLGFVGSPFTWTNMRRGLANIQERLDRALCNQE